MCGSENCLLNRADRLKQQKSNLSDEYLDSASTIMDIWHTQLGIFSLGERIQEHINQWHEHCLKMEHKRIAQRNEV
jgi:hypothetical protein